MLLREIKKIDFLIFIENEENIKKQRFCTFSQNAKSAKKCRFPRKRPYFNFRQNLRKCCFLVFFHFRLGSGQTTDTGLNVFPNCRRTFPVQTGPLTFTCC